MEVQQGEEDICHVEVTVVVLEAAAVVATDREEDMKVVTVVVDTLVRVTLRAVLTVVPQAVTGNPAAVPHTHEEDAGDQEADEDGRRAHTHTHTHTRYIMNNCLICTY